MEKCKCEGACLPCPEHKPIPTNLTTKHGLLYDDDDEIISLPEADSIANKYGFVYVEQLVRCLEKRQK